MAGKISSLVSCPVCQEFDCDVIFNGFPGKEECFESTVICKKCGVIFKTPIHPNHEKSEYQSISAWGNVKTFERKLNKVGEGIVNKLQNFVKKKKIRYLDVGTGPGWLPRYLSENIEDIDIFCIEASSGVASHLSKFVPKAYIMNAPLGGCDLPKDFFDVISVCGVDYLFHDHYASMEKLYHSLNSSGFLYIERNVFIDQESLTHAPIHDFDDLFLSNSLFHNWFMPIQYERQLSRWFHVFDKVEYICDETFRAGKLHKNRMIGYFCKKKEDIGYSPIDESSSSEGLSGYHDVMNYLQRFVADNSDHAVSSFLSQGIRSVALIGMPDELSCVRDFVSQRVDIEVVVNFEKIQEEEESKINLLKSAGIILICTQVRHMEIVSYLRGVNARGSVFNCFRPGGFSREIVTRDGIRLNAKAILPAKLKINIES